MVINCNKRFFYTIVFIALTFMSCRTKMAKHDVNVMANKDSLSIGIAVTTRHFVKLAEPVFANKHPKAHITSYIHETGNVVNDVIIGKTDIAITTRNLKAYEQEKSTTLIGTPIGIDGLVLVVSKNLPITNLTFDEIVKIWTGTYTNWNHLNGPNLPITVIGRTKNYDPIRLFADFLNLGSKEIEGGIIYSEKGIENWSKTISKATETDDLALEKLQNTPGAITYFPLQILNNYKYKGHSVKDVTFNSIKASYESIENGTYFIHRKLNVITNGKPKGLANTFINFILSDEGQQLIENAGFLKLKRIE